MKVEHKNVTYATKQEFAKVGAAWQEDEKKVDNKNWIDKIGLRPFCKKKHRVSPVWAFPVNIPVRMRTGWEMFYEIEPAAQRFYRICCFDKTDRMFLMVRKLR